MLRKKALNRIYLTTLVLFIMLISFTFDYLDEDKKRRSGCRDAAGTEVKRIRAYGGCLGTKSRRRTR